MKFFIFLILTISLSCCNFSNSKKNTTNNTSEIVSVETNETNKQINKTDSTSVWSKFQLRNTPLIDSTSFDNIKYFNKLTSSEIKTLQLEEIYPHLNDKGYNYHFYPSYSLNLGSFKTIVINVLNGDSELETILITYENQKINTISDGNDKFQIMKLVIAYDEIVEGWSRKQSLIQGKCINIFDALYTDEPQFDTTLYYINDFGNISKVNTEFKSNIRPNQKLNLNTIYNDTIIFVRYNDDYDYFFLEGRKNSQNVSLIYNWDDNNYSFNMSDSIIIKWKIDSIYIAGDGETLDFAEFVIDAIKKE